MQVDPKRDRECGYLSRRIGHEGLPPLYLSSEPGVVEVAPGVEKAGRGVCARGARFRDLRRKPEPSRRRTMARHREVHGIAARTTQRQQCLNE